uniref:Uncharacterized protein n=1 Tax=Lepeophtheirus salmonis TaxID=72036 RepID=A0A0K2TM94_LEPSM
MVPNMPLVYLTNIYGICRRISLDSLSSMTKAIVPSNNLTEDTMQISLTYFLLLMLYHINVYNHKK